MDSGVVKHIGIYAMTEEVVTGTQSILDRFGLPYLPMVHCFLFYRGRRVDLTEGNRNGKKRPIDEFLFTAKVAATISGKDEYLLYRTAVKEHILPLGDMQGVDLKTVLKAREEGLRLLRENIR